MDKGFFYVLTNPAQAGLILVDTSSRHPEERLLDDDLSGPGIPVPYELCYFALIEDCAEAMSLVHEALEERYVDKQFYKASPHDAVAALEHSGVEILYRESSVDSSEHLDSDPSDSDRPRYAPSGSEDGRLSPGRAGGRYRGRAVGPSRRVAPATYRTSLEERQERKRAALRRMASNNGIRDAEQNRGVQAPEMTPDTEFQAAKTQAPEPVETPAPEDVVPVHQSRREPMLTTVVDNTVSTAANDAPLVNDAVDDREEIDVPDTDQDSPKPGLRKLFGLGAAAGAGAAKVATQPVRLEPTVPVPAVAAESRNDTITARNEGSAAKAIEPEIDDIAEAAVEAEADAENDALMQGKPNRPSRNERRKQAKQAKKEAAALKRAQKEQEQKEKEQAAAQVKPEPKAEPEQPQQQTPKKTAPAQSDGAMPIPSLDLSAKPKKPAADKPGDAPATADLPQPSPQPHGIVYGPQGPIALHPVPGTPYMAMSPVQVQPGGGMMPGVPMGNMPMPAPVVHNVGATPQAPAGAQRPAPSVSGPGSIPPPMTPPAPHGASPAAPQGPAAMPDAGNSHQVEAWLNAQDHTAAKRASNRRAMLFSLIGIPLGLVTGGGYVVYQGLTDEKTIAIAVGGAVIASIISLYIVGRLTDNPNDTPPHA